MNKSNLNKALIEKEAKEVLNKFSDALKRVDNEKDNSSETFIDREEFEREETKPQDCEGFKEDFLNNAPKHDKDFIIAEKGGWK